MLVAIISGTAFGLVAPDQAKDAKWLADAFVQLVKTITAPVIFLTVVVGIASLGSLARAGGLAARALGYFLAATIIALALGLLAGNLVKPGSGFDGEPSKPPRATRRRASPRPATPAPGSSASSPTTCCRRASCSPSSRTRCCKVLVLAILVAAAISRPGAGAAQARRAAASRPPSKIIFGVIRMIMWVAPLGAFGGMAFTVAQFGGGALENLGMLLLTFWGTCRGLRLRRARASSRA